MRGWPKTLEAARDAFLKLSRRQDGVTADRDAVVDWQDPAPRTFASGGFIGAFGGSRDDVPIFIHPGDYRISLEAAKLLGRDFLEELNRPRLPAELPDHLLSEGGIVRGQPDQHGDDLGLVDPPVQPPSTPES